METSAPERASLRPVDWCLVTLYALALWSIPILVEPLMGIHETVHCLNTREMLATGDLIIPTYGGRPWLERPPLPFWITGAFVSLTGQVNADWAYRLGSMAVALVALLLMVGLAARQYGRSIAVLAGLILASTREFFIYATNTEADIFLCAVLTVGLYFFARAEAKRSLETRDGNPIGSRPWEVPAFFVAMGCLNWTKGLFFGTMIAGAVVVAYLALQGNLLRWRRYLWLWGGLAYAAVAAPWPILAMLRCPGIVDLWESDYLGRMSGSYMREPWWHYFACLPWNLFPWTIPALVGIVVARPVGSPRDSGEYRAYTLLLAWALAPVLGLSLANGKHHHYLLPVAIPWAIFSALGARYLWLWLRSLSLGWAALGLVALALVLPVEVALLFYHARLGITAEALPVVMTVVPVTVGLLLAGVTRPQPILAATLLFGLLWALDYSLLWHWDRNMNRPRSAGDLAFLQRIKSDIPREAPLYLVLDVAPLGSSWWLHYLEGRPQLLHDATFARQSTIQAPEIYLITRANHVPQLSQYGTCTVAFENANPRWVDQPEFRWQLVKLRYRDDLERLPPPAISPMQATGRAPGPILQ